MVVVVEVKELQAEETDVGEGGGSQTARAGPGCWVLLGWPWLVWLVGCARLVLYDIVFLSCMAAGPGLFLGVGCSVASLLGVARRACYFLCHVVPVHRFARSVCCVVCALSWATWLLFTGVHAGCVVLRVRCLGPLGSCSPVCMLGVLCCVCGVWDHLAPVHRCACLVCRVGVCGVLRHSAPVDRCARSACCVACAGCWATWLLFTPVHPRCAVMCVRCPGPFGFCSPVCMFGASFRVCSVLGHLTPVHRCAGSACCVACAVSPATWLLFTGVHAWCAMLRMWCPGPLGSCLLVCTLSVLCGVCGFPGHLPPVHRLARSMCCVACAPSWAARLLFTGVYALCVVLRVRCLGPFGSCSQVCTLGVLCCMCGVLGQSAPVHCCARLVCCVARAVSWATWLPFIGAHILCAVLCVRFAGPLGSCSPVCTLGVLCCVCGVLGHLAAGHRCARSVCSVACAVSWATQLLCTGLHARCAALRVPCPGPLGSCSPVRTFDVLCCSYGVLGHLAPVHRCACSLCCVVCAVSWATWLLFTVAHARCVVWCWRCPGPLGSCPPVCMPGAVIARCL